MSVKAGSASDVPEQLPVSKSEAPKDSLVEDRVLAKELSIGPTGVGAAEIEDTKPFKDNDAMKSTVSSKAHKEENAGQSEAKSETQASSEVPKVESDAPMEPKVGSAEITKERQVEDADPSKDEHSANFEGNVQVSQALPTQEDLDKCADLVLLDSKGESRPFKSLYSGDGIAKRQLLIFVRHFFCGNCQEFLRTLSSIITPDSLLTLPEPTFIAVVGCGRPDLIDMYAETTKCPFPIYADPTRQLYDRLGMTRTYYLGQKPRYIQSTLISGAVQSALQMLGSGGKIMKGGDFKQVGGEFLVEDGKVTWCHRMRSTRDHSEIEKLQQILGLDKADPPWRKRWSRSVKEIGRRSSSWGRRASIVNNNEKTAEDKKEQASDGKVST